MARDLVLNVITRADTKGLNSLSGKLQTTGLNLTKFVTAPLVGAGIAAVKLGAEAQKTGAKLEAVFKNVGKQSGRTLTQLTDQATTLGETTLFDDEGIKDAQAALLTFQTVSGDAFTQAIDLSADMAAAMGGEPVAAAELLGKALAEPDKAAARLRRSGVILTQQQQDQIKAFEEAGDSASAQGVILDAVAEKYNGVATEIANTDAGKASEAFQQLGEAGEAIGTFLLPVLANLASGLRALADWFNNLDPGMQQFIVTIATVAAAVGPVVFAIGKLIPAIKGVIIVFDLLKVALLTNPFTALAIAVVAIAALIILNWDKILGFLKGVWKAITDALGKLGDFFADTWQGIVDATTSVFSTIVGIVKGVVNGVIDVINGLFGFLNGIQIGIPSVDVGPVHIGGGVIDPFNIGLIPHLAEGGIIDRPTLALIGEKGPEVVTPLDKAPTEEHFHSHIDVRGEDPFIRNEEGLIRANHRIAFLAGF